MNKKKGHFIRIAVAFVLGAVVMTSIRYFSYGGMNTGSQVNQEAFSEAAGSVSDVVIPENVKIVALGEATYGNKEFQELKLEVFKKLIEEYNCKTFALEADYGGCLIVNEYIHGAEGITEDDVVKALAFHIYQTEEMRELIRYMEDYNKKAEPEDMSSFYGFDMQSYEPAKNVVDSACKELAMQYDSMVTLITL